MKRVICLFLALGAAAAAQSFTTTGSMNAARAGTAAVLLASGKVLVLGGSSGIDTGALASAELYDPSSGTFTSTGSLSVARSDPQAVLLQSGKVFVISDGDTSTDIYNPSAGTFGAGPALPVALGDPHAVGLPDGRVWITGVTQGCQAPTCTSPIDLYDPKAGTITAAGQLLLARSREAVAGLGDGRVFVFGGWSVNAVGASSPTGSVEVCDAAAACSAAPQQSPMQLADAGAVLLGSGQVLICGGNGHFSSATTGCQLYDPSAQTFTPTTGAMAAGRLAPTLTRLPDGTVLVAGGRNGPGPDGEIYRPQLGTFTSAGDFETARLAALTGAPFATLLPNDTVLIAGGISASDPTVALSEAEIFTPAPPAPDFSIAAQPTQVGVSTGTTAAFTLTAHGTAGFSGAISLGCTGNGSNTCTFSPASITSGQSSTLTFGGLDLTGTTPIAFQVVGTSGALSHTLDLRVLLQPPKAVLSINTLSFGNQNVGSTSPSQQLALANGGAATLNINGITVSGDFAETDDCPKAIANGGPSCTIHVTFAPAASGDRTGTLAISDDAPFSPQTVALAGTGVAAPAPTVALAPTSLSFGKQTDGTSSAPQTVTVTNSGNADLVITSATASGDFSATGNCAGVTVAASKSCAIAVTFKPSASGDHTGALALADNASDSPRTAALTGTGEDPPEPAATFTPTVGNMTTARISPAVVRLADGTVLIAGGTTSGGSNGTALGSAEIYNPTDGTFQATGNMTTPLTASYAALLPKGDVLIVGGMDSNADPFESTELFNPASRTFAPGPPLPIPLTDIVSLPLADGRVWIFGGDQGCSGPTCLGIVEIYDPATDAISVSGTLDPGVGDEGAIQLEDGNILLYGGSHYSPSSSAIGNAELYDLASGVFRFTQGSPFPVTGAATARLTDGQGLACGGASYGGNYRNQCELYDSKMDTFNPTGGTTASRVNATMIALPDGSALVAGGNDPGTSPDAEIYNPKLFSFSSAGNFNTERTGFRAVELKDGTVLFVGGADANGNALSSAEIFAEAAPAPDFSLSADSQTKTVTSGTTATFTLTANAANGFSASIALSCTPATVACTFAPTSITPGQTSTLTVSGLDTSKPGTTALQAVGSSGSTTHAVALTVDVAPPGAAPSPATLSFGTEDVGSTSAPQTVTLTNPGATALAIASVTAQGDFSETNTCGSNLAGGGATCTIAVSFAPVAGGNRSGVLLIADNAPTSPQAVVLTGTGSAAPAPAAALAPGSLSFASTTVGQTARAQTITLSNSGNADLTGVAVTASGDFAETSNCGATLAAGKSCAVSVTFTPTAAGTRLGEIAVADNASTSPQGAALSGTGAAATAPAVTLAPTSLSFSDQAVGSASSAQTVTLTNAGNAALAINKIAATGDFTATNQCGSSLDAGKSCAVSVTFSPTATGNRTGQLQFTDNASGSPQTVSLAGSGTAAAAPPAPGGVSFAPASGSSATATVAAGKAASYGLTLDATGGFSGTVTLSCSGTPAGAACAFSPASVTLGSTSAPVTVTVTTTAPAGSAALPPEPSPPSLPGGSAPLWPWAGLGVGLALAGLGLLWVPRRKWVLVTGLEVALALGLAACGGSAGSTGSAASTSTPPPAAPAPTSTATPAGTYPLTITASSNGAAVGSTQLTLTVR